jgi:hypothetical protein
MNQHGVSDFGLILFVVDMYFFHPTNPLMVQRMDLHLLHGHDRGLVLFVPDDDSNFTFALSSVLHIVNVSFLRLRGNRYVFFLDQGQNSGHQFSFDSNQMDIIQLTNGFLQKQFTDFFLGIMQDFGQFGFT